MLNSTCFHITKKPTRALQMGGELTRSVFPAPALLKYKRIAPDAPPKKKELKLGSTENTTSPPKLDIFQIL
jgi:hypothetical protein